MERCCFTIWLSERRGRSAVRQPVKLAPPQPLDTSSMLSGSSSQAQLQEVLRFLLQPAVRQHVCKLIYAGEPQPQGGAFRYV